MLFGVFCGLVSGSCDNIISGYQKCVNAEIVTVHAVPANFESNYERHGAPSRSSIEAAGRELRAALASRALADQLYFADGDNQRLFVVDVATQTVIFNNLNPTTTAAGGAGSLS